MKISNFLHAKGITYNAYNVNEKNNFFSSLALANKIKFHLIECEGEKLLMATYSNTWFSPSNEMTIEQILKREFVSAEFQGEELSKEEVIELLNCAKKDNLKVEVKDIQTSLNYFLSL